MKPPREYFTLCDSRPFPKSDEPPFPGAQRVGFEWYIFSDQDSLGRMINDGALDASKTFEEVDCSECESKDVEISDLEDEVKELKEEITKLKKGKSS